MELCYQRKTEEHSLASASFADRQLEYDILKSLQLKVIMSLRDGCALPTVERAFAMLFSCSFMIACMDYKEIAAVSS